MKKTEAEIKHIGRGSAYLPTPALTQILESVTVGFQDPKRRRERKFQMDLRRQRVSHSKNKQIFGLLSSSSVYQACSSSPPLPPEPQKNFVSPVA